MKSAILSKIIIVQLLGLTLDFLSLPRFVALIPPEAIIYITSIQGLLTILLRFSGGSISTLQVKS